jgi:transmembrane sensor
MERLQELFRLYYNKTATEEQKMEFMFLVQHSPPEALSQLIAEHGGQLQDIDEVLEPQRAEKLLANILAKDRPAVRRISIRTWWAAAVVLVAMGIGGYFLFLRAPSQKPLVSLSQEQRFKNDIAPAQQQVLLTLPDGTVTSLDSLQNGSLHLSGAQAVKEEGSLSYQPIADGHLAFNTVTTQKGRVFHLQLTDGTDVWLDALSSIRFPAAFPKGDRIVEVNGQAYFEVAQNPAQPFKVKSGGQVVEVLGTHFNINTYNQEMVRTTLLEGSVKVQADQSSIIIRPGQQAVLSAELRLSTNASPDLDEVMAWKNGRFLFNGNTMEEIMDQIARWYNIKVVYKDKINETFVADINRNLPISKLLSLLEMTHQIKFVIEGDQVTVTKW